MADAPDPQQQAQMASNLKEANKQQEKLTKSTTSLLGSFGKLYGTVSNSSANIQKPFEQAGQAVADTGQILKAGIEKFVGQSGVVGDILDRLGDGAKLYGAHQQKLTNFTQELSGSTGLTIKSYTQLYNNLSKSNSSLLEFQGVQANATLFLSEMGGKVRGASGQVSLFSDITNKVNDDFEKLGQMGLSVAEKQELMGDMMVTLRQVGLEAGTSQERASAMVSASMQNMTLEANKMAAITGKSRRETLAQMAEQMKTNADAKITAEIASEKYGHTADQAMKVRQGMISMETMMKQMGPTGEKLQQAFLEASDTGQPFSLMLARMAPNLHQMLKGNDEYMNGMQSLLDKGVKAGEGINAEEVAKLNKNMFKSVNNDMMDSALLSKEMREEFRNLKLMEVNARELAVGAGEDTKTQMENLKDTAAGQAANIQSAMNQTLNQAQNIADTLLTVGTEVFNNEFADNTKDWRDKVKEFGTNATGAMNNWRNSILDVNEIQDSVSSETKQYLSEDVEARKQAALAARAGMDDLMATMQVTGEGRKAMQSLLGTSTAETDKIKDNLLNYTTESAEKLQAMKDALTNAHNTKIGDFDKMALDLAVPADKMASLASSMGLSIDENGVLIDAQTAAANSLVAQYEALDRRTNEVFAKQVENLALAKQMTDANFDKLIDGVLKNQTIELGPGSAALLESIKEHTNSQDIIEKLMTLNKGVNTEQDGVIQKLDEVKNSIEALKLNVDVKNELTNEQMTFYENITKSFKQGAADIRDNLN